MYAVIDDKIKAVKLLLKMGADPDLCDNRGRSPLMRLMGERGNFEMLLLLSKHTISY